MTSVLDFERYHNDLNRQLLRRIGYTNGLHRIRRFARIVEYVYSAMPTSLSFLVQLVIREENEFIAEDSGARPLSGKKYAEGIVNVAQALTLLEKFGPRIALSSQGYACHALNKMENKAAIDTFLLEKVIEVDGEYTLNILRLVDEGFVDTLTIGRELAERFLEVIRFKASWADSGLPDRFSQRILKTALSDAERVFAAAVTPPEYSMNRSPAGTAEFFLKHTVNPRLEWLTDLGCIRSDVGGGRVVTDSGRMILKTLKRLGGWKERFILLPFDSWLTSQLSMPNLYEAESAKDFSWVLTASKCTAWPTRAVGIKPDDLLHEIRAIYADVKLANFNEADALSIYEVLATVRASNGQVLTEDEFNDSLASLLRSHPGELFKLSKRRGRGQYIALKNASEPA